MVCKQCGKSIRVRRGEAAFELNAWRTELIYSDFDVERRREVPIDAGVFCGPSCLVDYFEPEAPKT